MENIVDAKSGQFYTPIDISALIAKLVAPKENDRIYDPACGSGALLLKAYKEAKTKKVSLYGQEINSRSYSICKMNMFLHNVYDANIQWGDTLSNPLHLQNDTLMKFDVIVSNPPFSVSRWERGFEEKNNRMLQKQFKFEASMDKYGRFKYGVPPKSNGDYAFISHMLASLSNEGIMAVVLPHGVLFRSGAEQKIRKKILEENLVDAVIGLPSNLFYNTSIPVVIVVFKKNRERKEVLFIEASREFMKEKSENKLSDENIEKIVNTYKKYEEIDKYSHIATLEEIQRNEFNLNIKRYVDTFNEEEVTNIEKAKDNIKKIEYEILKLNENIEKYLRQL